MMIPNVVIDSRGEPFIRGGQQVMYRSNLFSADPEVQDGEIVRIRTQEGEFLAYGFYSAKSHAAVKIFSFEEGQIPDEELFEKRIRQAYEYRKKVEPGNLDNCRLIYGEADHLPGWTLDRYNDILVSQIVCAGLEKRRELLYRLLVKVLKEDGQDVKTVYERNDLQSRQKEGLPLYKGFYGESSLSPLTVINENGLKMRVDVENGQKTGYFLDQKANRLKVREIAKGLRVLDCFCHTGGFALNAALGGAAAVTAVDVSAEALNQAEANAKLNHLEDKVNFVQADVFEYLDALEPGQYDLIILDPPAFTKSRKTVMSAFNGYKHINSAGMRLVKDKGLLVTCSCSRYMEKELFEKMLEEAAAQAGAKYELLSFAAQNADHPVAEEVPESLYLKFYVLRPHS